jgi:hypothetical protein
MCRALLTVLPTEPLKHTSLVDSWRTSSCIQQQQQYKGHKCNIQQPPQLPQHMHMPERAVVLLSVLLQGTPATPVSCQLLDSKTAVAAAAAAVAVDLTQAMASKAT